MSKKTLFEKIEELIENHIEEIVDKKMTSQKQSLEKFIEKEINNNKKTTITKKKAKSAQNNIIIKNEKIFVDVYGTSCSISDVNQDHIMPKELNGSGAKSNLMWICIESNRIKKNNINGEIMGTKFSVITTDKKSLLNNGKIVGTLSVYDKKHKLYVQKSTRRENNKFTKLKESSIEK